MKYIFYRPEVSAYINTEYMGPIDITDDIVSGSVNRITNGVSTCSLTLNNRMKKYNRKIRPMDPVVVFLKRVRWVQVFAGYIDSAPYETLYPGTVSIAASDTLKRLMFTYWDPGLPKSQELLTKRWVSGGGQDGGMGMTIVDLLTQVGGWDKRHIFITGIPSDFIKRASQLVQQVASESRAYDKLEALLGGSHSGTTSTGAVPGSIPEQFKTAIAMASQKYGVDAALIAAIIQQESSWNPKSIGHNSNSTDYGLMQVNDVSWKKTFPNLFVNNNWQDPVQNIDVGTYEISNDLKVSGGDIAQALGRYNAGGNWKRVLSTYSAKVIAYYNQYKNSSTTGTTASASAGIGVQGNTTIPVFGWSSSTATFKKIFGASEAEVAAQLVDVNFQGHVVKFHRLAAGALQAVDRAWTATGINYPLKSTNTIRKWGTIATGGTEVSRHTFGVCIDINPATNPFGAPLRTDIPPAIRKCFEDNGFYWGGNWVTPDAMHFVYGGGNTNAYLGIGVSAGVGGQVGAAPSVMSQIMWGLYKVPQISMDSLLYTGYLSLLNDEPLLNTVTQLVTSSLRSYSSSPDGKFLAWFPDYFGTYKGTPYFDLEDIEILDCNINWSDDKLTTHVFLTGDTDISGKIDFVDWFQTLGIVSVEMKDLFDTILNMDDSEKQLYTKEHIFSRYGARPAIVNGYNLVRDRGFEFMAALQMFMFKWAEQFKTDVSFTFMPELFPGGRVGLKDHDLALYVNGVNHSFDMESGFSTSATMVAPSSLGGSLSLLPRVQTGPIPIITPKTQVSVGEVE